MGRKTPFIAHTRARCETTAVNEAKRKDGRPRDTRSRSPAATPRFLPGRSPGSRADHRTDRSGTGAFPCRRHSGRCRPLDSPTVAGAASGLPRPETVTHRLPVSSPERMLRGDTWVEGKIAGNRVEKQAQTQDVRRKDVKTVIPASGNPERFQKCRHARTGGHPGLRHEPHRQSLQTP